MQDQDILKQISKQNIDNANASDVCYSFVSTSRFIFYLKVLSILTFLIASCFVLNTYRFKHPKVNINESSLYTPNYK